MKLRTCILTYWKETPATNLLASTLGHRNHQALVLSPQECSIRIDAGKVSVCVAGQPVEGINLVLTRCVTHFYNGRLVDRNLEALVASVLVGGGAVAVNEPRSKLLASDKVASLTVLASSGVPVPPTVLVTSPAELSAEMPALSYPSVIKMNEGRGGAGVMRVDSAESLRSVADGLINLGHPLLVQRYILTPRSPQARVLVLGGEVLTAFEAKARPGDFRANISAGATLTPTRLDPAIARACVVGVQALGLDFAGVDLIAQDDAVHVIEVNPAPGLDFVDPEQRAFVGNALVDFLEKAVEKGQRSAR